MPKTRDRWTAFFLSLIAPGAGQLYMGHGSSVVWLLGAGGLGALSMALAPHAPMPTALVNLVAFALYGLASAEHAKRCRDASGRGVTSRVDCRIERAAVRLCIELEVPRPPGEVWPIVADFTRFVCVDPFHTRVVIEGDEIQPGVKLALKHRAFGVTLWRVGKLLTWRDGHGYAFSDLSARGTRVGFPHVFFVSIRPAGVDKSTYLRIDVRGRWTASWVPRFARHWWLRYVCLEHARLLRGLFSQENTWLTLPNPRTRFGRQEPMALSRRR